MSRISRAAALLGALLLAAPLSAQSAMEHDKKPAAPIWKELDAYHEFMMATWHPAKAKNDLGPIREKAADMVKAAKVVAASKMPAACAAKSEVQKGEMAKSHASLPAETEKVAKLVAAKAGDAELKEALKALHDSFEVLEEGCAGAVKHDDKKDEKK